MLSSINPSTARLAIRLQVTKCLSSSVSASKREYCGSDLFQQENWYGFWQICMMLLFNKGLWYRSRHMSYLISYLGVKWKTGITVDHPSFRMGCSPDNVWRFWAGNHWGLLSNYQRILSISKRCNYGVDKTTIGLNSFYCQFFFWLFLKQFHFFVEIRQRILIIYVNYGNVWCL